jgi:type I restriction enzyme, S subunit
VSWPTAALGEITKKIGSGSTPRGGQESYKVDGVPLIRSMNVHDGEFIDDGLAYLDEQQAAALKHVTLQTDDVLLNITGASVARVCRLPERFSGGRVNQHVSIVRPDTNRLDAGFLAHLLRAPEAKARLLRVAGAGATREAITKAQIEEFRISLPPLGEQRRVAAILDKADAMRRKRARALELLNGLTKAIFLEMFVRGNGRDDRSVPLREICQKITDGTHQSPKWADSGVPFLFVSNIRGQEISFETKNFVSEGEYERLTKHSPIESGDVLYTAVGSYGHAAIVPTGRKFVFQRHIAHIKPKPSSVNSKYLSVALEMPDAKRQADKHARGIAQKTVTLASLKELTVPLPPIEMQEKFTAKADAIYRQANLSGKHLGQADMLFSSLQHRAFSGQH